MVLVNKSIEALVDCLSDHLSSGDKLGIKLVQDVFEVVSLHIFLRIEQLQELLHKLRCNVRLEALHIASLIDDKLKEEFINALKMGPGGINFLLLFNTSLGERKTRVLLDVGKRSEDVLLNHLHHLVKIRNDELDDASLFLKKGLQLAYGVDSFRLAFDVLGLVVVIVNFHANLELLEEQFLHVFT